MDTAWIWVASSAKKSDYVGRYSHRVFAVRRMNKLAPPNRPQAIDPHQGAYPVSTHGQTTLSHSRSQPAAAVGLVTGCKGRLEVDAGGAHHGLCQALLARSLVDVKA